MNTTQIINSWTSRYFEGIMRDPEKKISQENRMRKKRSLKTEQRARGREREGKKERERVRHIDRKLLYKE